MDSVEQVYYGALALATVVGLVFGAYKLRPDSTRVFVDSAKVSVEISDALRDDLRDDVAALRQELAERRSEEAQYRSNVEMRLSELSRELREEREEKERVKQENLVLRARISSLEDSIRRLEAGKTLQDPQDP